MAVFPDSVSPENELGCFSLSPKSIQSSSSSSAACGEMSVCEVPVPSGGSWAGGDGSGVISGGGGGGDPDSACPADCASSDRARLSSASAFFPAASGVVVVPSGGSIILRSSSSSSARFSSLRAGGGSWLSLGLSRVERVAPCCGSASLGISWAPVPSGGSWFGGFVTVVWSISRWDYFVV